MKKSEKILAGLTSVVLLGWLGITLLEGDETSSGGADVLESLQNEYQSRISQIELADTISEEYFELVGRGNDQTTRVEGEKFRPDLDFQNQVTEWCTQFGFNNPGLEKETEEIKDVDDYLLVSITVSIREGNYKNVAELIKRFETRGLIIQEVDISSRLDREGIDADITIGKIVENYFG